MQARMSKDDPRLYNVNRDIAHNFEFVIMEVGKAIESRRFSPLTRLAKEHNVTDQELGKTCQALCLFMATQADVPKESMPQCLERSGFLSVNPIAQVIVIAYIGQIILGCQWVGVREATLGGSGPAASMKKLRWYGKKMGLIMAMPLWKRKLYNLRKRFYRAWYAFSEKTIYDA